MWQAQGVRAGVRMWRGQSREGEACGLVLPVMQVAPRQACFTEAGGGGEDTH